MYKKTIILGATAFVLGAVALLPQTTLAYKGDATVQGPNYTQERHEAMIKAYTNKDYNAWKTLMNGKGVARRITADNFARFSEAHQLSLEGKTNEAAAIRAELGLGQQSGSGMGQARVNH